MAIHRISISLSSLLIYRQAGEQVVPLGPTFARGRGGKSSRQRNKLAVPSPLDLIVHYEAIMIDVGLTWCTSKVDRNVFLVYVGLGAALL